MYQLPEIKPRRKARSRYIKSAAVKELEALANADAQRKHPNIEKKYLAPRKYEDRTANGLTRCVIDFIRLSGYQSERINCTGRPIDNTMVYENVLGDLRKIGSTTWLPTSGQKGTADISAVIRGRAVKIEIKAGRDKQRPDQVAYQQEIERAGGLYWICHSFDEFKMKYDSILNT